MKNLLSIAVMFLFFTTLTIAQDKVAETEFKVFGNCNMCKNRIEKTLKIKEVKLAKWDKKSKVLKVAYLKDEITLDSLKHRLAEVGHDTDKFKAADSVYSKLPNCCFYRDSENTH